MAAAIESDIITCEINLQPLTSCLRQISETLAAQEVQHSQEIQQLREQVESNAIETAQAQQEHLPLLHRLEHQVEQLQQQDTATRARFDTISSQFETFMMQLAEKETKESCAVAVQTWESELEQIESTDPVVIPDEQPNFVTHEELLDVQENILSIIESLPTSIESEQVEISTEKSLMEEDLPLEVTSPGETVLPSGQENTTDSPRVASPATNMAATRELVKKLIKAELGSTRKSSNASRHFEEKLETLADRHSIYETQAEEVTRTLEALELRLEELGEDRHVPSETEPTMFATTTSGEGDEPVRVVKQSVASGSVSKGMLRSYLTKKEHDVAREKVLMMLDELKNEQAVNMELFGGYQASIDDSKKEINELRERLHNLIEDQSLLGELMKGQDLKSNDMDLSCVFAKLSDLRTAHERSASNLRETIDDIYAFNKLNSNQVSDLRTQMEESRKLRIKQLQEELDNQKKSVERVLDIQRRIQFNVQDWRSPLDIITRRLRAGELDKTLHERFTKEVHSYSRRMYRLLPTISQIQAAPMAGTICLDRIKNLATCFAEEIVDPKSDELEPLAQLKEQIEVTKVMFEEVLIENEKLSNDLDRTRQQMDTIQMGLEKALPQPSEARQQTPVVAEIVKKHPSLSVECQTTAELERKVSSIPRPEVDQTRIREIGQKVVSFSSRLDSLEDEVDEIQSKYATISTRVLGKVDIDYIARIKRDIYSEFSKIHATIVSMSMTCNVPESLKEEIVAESISCSAEKDRTVEASYDDSIIKQSLDDQAELIADLYRQFPKPSTAEEKPLVESSGKEGIQIQLESISDRVADIYMKMQQAHKLKPTSINTTTDTQRNTVPITNQAFFMSTLMQKVEAKLDDMRDVTAEDMKRMRSQLQKVLKKRIKKAIESQGDPHHSNESAIGVVCLACHRPVDKVTKIDNNITLLDSRFENIDPSSQNEGEKEYVYRGGFKMPISTDKKTTLPFLPSTRKSSGGLKDVRRMRVGEIVNEANNLSEEQFEQFSPWTGPLSPSQRKTTEERRPMPPTKQKNST